MMQIRESFDELRDLGRPIHWAMGFFDGVHRGHARVIQSADTPGALRGVLTFAQHPLAVLKPEAQPRLLTPDAAFKAQRIASLGVDVLLRLPFTPELASTAAADFLERLAAAAPLAGVSVGVNWHFGRGGAGNADLLRQLAARGGFRACISELLQQEGDTICSSRIRELLAAGDLERAGVMLGYPFALVGTVEHGQHLARDLGYPTANITLPPHAALPPFGVYDVSCTLDGQPLHGIANLGLRPTIREQHKVVRLETHLLGGFCGDLYGRRLTVTLRRFLRPEQPFSSLAALREQIARDVAAVQP